MPTKLQLKVAQEKRTPCKNSLTLLHEYRNMTSVSLHKKMMFAMKDFFSKSVQILRKLLI